MPLAKASRRAVADAKPVRAIIVAGFWPRSRSKFRIDREESIPFITGIEISVFSLAFFDAPRQDFFTHEYDIVGPSRILKCLQCQEAVFCGVVLEVILPCESFEKLSKHH
jgi:hypothetical protein